MTSQELWCNVKTSVFAQKDDATDKRFYGIFGLLTPFTEVIIIKKKPYLIKILKIFKIFNNFVKEYCLVGNVTNKSSPY